MRSSNIRLQDYSYSVDSRNTAFSYLKIFPTLELASRPCLANEKDGEGFYVNNLFQVTIYQENADVPYVIFNNEQPNGDTEEEFLSYISEHQLASFGGRFWVEQTVTPEGDAQEVYHDMISVIGHKKTCHICQGRGSFVNPAIDSNGLSEEDFYDEDFMESYRSGVYNMTCPLCNGEGQFTYYDKDNQKTLIAREFVSQYNDKIDCHYQDIRERARESYYGY